jgi:hypothetical protein
MKTKRRRTSARVLLAFSGALAATTASIDTHAAGPPPPTFTSALSDVNGVLGAISNAYGTLQAAQFLAALIGIGSGPSMKDAINQIENFIQAYRDQTLVANVGSDLALFRTISSDYQNGLTDGLEGNFYTFTNRDFFLLNTAIQNGDMTDAYMLGPAFNLLGMSLVGGMKAIGIQNPANAYPQSAFDSYLSQMVTTDYSLVGGVTVNMDVSCSVVGPMSSGAGANDLFQWTQGGKKMWPKYSPLWWLSGPPNSCPDQRVPGNGSYFCDFTQACNTVSNELACCSFICGPGYLPSVPFTPAATTAAIDLLAADREAFLADPSVSAVRSGMLGATSALDPSLSIISDAVPTATCQGHVLF